MFRWPLFWASGFVLLSNRLIFKLWFQGRNVNEVNASLLLNLINNNFLIFFTENLLILNPYLTPKSETLRPILVTLLKMRPCYSHSTRENVASCKGVPPPLPSRVKG